MQQTELPAVSGSEVTDITKSEPSGRQNCGTISMTNMQVFTTVFLVETLRATVECNEETDGLDQNLPGTIEFKQALRNRIAQLESRGFYESEDPDD